MIAALYVETDGAYFGLPNIDAWDEPRDARKYAGPYPVVAHPPCQKWGSNVSDHDGSTLISEYTVQINNGPVIAEFAHWRKDGLAACLRLAADAVEASGHPNPFATDETRRKP